MAKPPEACTGHNARFLPQRQLDLASWNFLVLCALALATVGYFRAGPRIGDGLHYYLMLISISENGTVYTTPATAAVYDEYAFKHPRRGLAKFARIDTKNRLPTSGPDRVEFNHFWFYSLLASSFYWPLKWLGVDVGQSFNLLHLALLFWAAYVAHRRLGPRATSSLILLVVFSPALWFINKAHTEFFTVMTTSIAILYFLSGRYVWCAAWFAAASTQNPPFGILAIIALGCGFAEQRWKPFGEHKRLLAATAALMAIHPGYYLLMHGTLTPSLLTGHTHFGGDLLPIGRMAALWIDPDLGLFPNWPWGLVILAVFAWLCFRRKVRLRPRLVLLGMAVILILGWSNTRAGNISHGGTVHVSRYGLWYLCLFLPLLWRVVQWLATQRRAMVATLAAVALVPALFTMAQYWPDRREVFHRPTRFSLVFYEYLPWLYDPIPEIFSERYGNEEDCEAWAVSHPSGNKILVWDDAPYLDTPQQAPNVRGCPELDPVAVCKLAKRRLAQQPNKYYVYLNGLGSVLARPGKAP